jgi:osmotically-inducible protein OsmY
MATTYPTSPWQRLRASRMAHVTAIALLATTLGGALSGCAPAIVAGAAAGGLVVVDRRTVGTQAEDTAIFAKAESRINSQFGSRVHVNATSYNRRVLLTGEVPDAETKAAVARVAGAVENVVGVVNELTIGDLASLTSRTNDSIITSKVKGNLIDNKNIDANLVKVVTEAGVVYLMGLVTRTEGDTAASVASRTSGVVRVVKSFEYIQPPPVAAPAKPPVSPNAGGEVGGVSNVTSPKY